MGVEDKIDAMITRLTALRAGYLDNLAAGPVALASALVTHDGKLDVVDGVVDHILTHVEGGGPVLADAVWSHFPRTLTVTPIVPLPTATENDIFIERGDTYVLSFTALGSLVGRTKLWFTLKRSSQEPDSVALVMVTEAAGLVLLNGAAPGAGITGTIVVSDPVAGNVTVALSAPATASLEPSDDLRYDVQVAIGAAVDTLVKGDAEVTADVTRATA